MPHHIVLVLDSGIGGMSVAQKIRALMPNVQIIYIADTAAFPYGNKTAVQMQQRLQQLLEVSTKKFCPNIGVIACNSASTAVLGLLRETCSIPLVGVVPAIKPAAKLSKSKSIGVLATAHTAASHYTKSLIKQFATDCEVSVYGSKNLAQLAEKKYRGAQLDLALIKGEIEKLTRHNKLSPIDTIVLACTHFPLLIDELKAAAPHIDHWVDSGDAIAKRVEFCLSSRPADTSGTTDISSTTDIPSTPITSSTPNTSSSTKPKQNLFLVTSSNAAYSQQMLANTLGDYKEVVLSNSTDTPSSEA